MAMIKVPSDHGRVRRRKKKKVRSGQRGNAQRRLVAVIKLFLIALLAVMLLSTSHLLSSFLMGGGTDPARQVVETSIKDEEGASFINPRGIKQQDQCKLAVVLGASLDFTRALLANVYSMSQNYADPDRDLCIFVFSSEHDLETRTSELECAFTGISLPERVQIISKLITHDNWDPPLVSENLFQRKELNGIYNWFRFYLQPADIGGLQRFIWLDSDIIVRANIAELYDWDLKGKVIAGGIYNEPLWHQLCSDNKDELKKIPMTENHVSPLELKWNMNAGLIVFDLEQMKAQGILEEWARLKEINDKRCIWKIQQSAFTLAIHGIFEHLTPEWNHGCLGWMDGFKGQIGEVAAQKHIDACQSAKLLHWNGRHKPWAKKDHELAVCAEFWHEYDLVTLHHKEKCTWKEPPLSGVIDFIEKGKNLRQKISAPK